MRRVERGRVAPTQAFKAPHCSGVILLELPPTSKWLRPSTPLCSNSSYQPRIVSSSNKRTSATAHPLIQQHQGIGAPCPAPGGQPAASQRDQRFAILFDKKAAANHAAIRIRPTAKRKTFFPSPH